MKCEKLRSHGFVRKEIPRRSPRPHDPHPPTHTHALGLRIISIIESALEGLSFAGSTFQQVKFFLNEFCSSVYAYRSDLGDKAQAGREGALDPSDPTLFPCCRHTACPSVSAQLFPRARRLCLGPGLHEALPRAFLNSWHTWAPRAAAAGTRHRFWL